MMNWTFEEFLYELDQDPDRIVLFVEGTSDETFWLGFCPKSQRNDSVVYPVCVVDIEDQVHGGERGRLLVLAGMAEQSRHFERIRFLIDADFDHLCEVPHQLAIWRTDGRDLESYLLIGSGAEKLCETVCGGFDTKIFRAAVSRMMRSLGVARLVDYQENFRIPFQRTLEGRYSRFLSGRDLSIIEMNYERLLNALAQNAGLSKADTDLFKSRVKQRSEHVKEVPDHQLIHGKDLTHVVTMVAGCDAGVATYLIRAAIILDRESLLHLPTIKAANDWLVHRIAA